MPMRCILKVEFSCVNLTLLPLKSLAKSPRVQHNSDRSTTPLTVVGSYPNPLHIALKYATYKYAKGQWFSNHAQSTESWQVTWLWLLLFAFNCLNTCLRPKKSWIHVKGRRKSQFSYPLQGAQAVRNRSQSQQQLQQSNWSCQSPEAEERRVCKWNQGHQWERSQEPSKMARTNNGNGTLSGAGMSMEVRQKGGMEMGTM